jgi:ABC-type dipeptide/oligopeptide/nickel transport system permease component
MLRFAIRRILWAIPTLFGISVVVFFITTLLPDPAASSFARGGDVDSIRATEELRRARFLDLPRFFNSAPPDVASRADDAIEHIVADDDHRTAAALHLVTLGGAAFPYVLPRLEGLAPEARGRVALALVPIAVRMELATAEQLARPEAAITFFTHFWEDRSLDFTAPAVNRAVSRLLDHGTDLREQDLRAVDTFALAEIMSAMSSTQDRVALARLSRLAVHATGRGNVIPVDAGETYVHRVRAEWREYWYVHRTDFVVLAGAERITSTIGETRYGKWLMRAASGHFGLSVRDGEPIADKLRARAPITLLITAIAMLASYALAIPIGAITAWRKGKPTDLVLAAILFGMYSLPTFWAAELLRRMFASGLASDANIGPDRLILPIVALTLGSLATLARHQRTAVLDVLQQDYIRTARAKGVPTWRWVVLHALRNALLPTATLAGLQLPALLGGAFVVEEIFTIPGLGYETLRAVESHDAAWLMSTIVIAAVVTTIGLIASDVAYGMLDPRIRETLMRRQEARR